MAKDQAVNNDELRLIAQQAFIDLAQEVNSLLDASKVLAMAQPFGKSGAVRYMELIDSDIQISRLVKQLSHIVVTWMSQKPQTISRDGIQQHIINELWACMEAAFFHLTINGASAGCYSRGKALIAVNTLNAINKVLT